jgi:hypothetical protein
MLSSPVDAHCAKLSPHHFAHLGLIGWVPTLCFRMLAAQQALYGRVERAPVAREGLRVEGPGLSVNALDQRLTPDVWQQIVK